MGRLNCECGHVTSNVQGPSRATGDILGDVARARSSDEWTRSVSGFLAASRAGRRHEWLVEHRFDPSAYPEGTDQDLIFDLHASAVDRVSRRIWECEACGRLYVQSRPDRDEWKCFRPESGTGYEGILAPFEAV